MNREAVTCPACNGERSNVAFVDGHRADGTPFGEVRRIECYRCKGSGTVPLEMLRWMQVGTLKRKERIKRFETLKDAAGKMGIDYMTLSKMEAGLIPWAEVER